MKIIYLVLMVLLSSSAMAYDDNSIYRSFTKNLKSLKAIGNFIKIEASSENTNEDFKKAVSVPLCPSFKQFPSREELSGNKADWLGRVVIIFGADDNAGFAEKSLVSSMELQNQNSLWENYKGCFSKIPSRFSSLVHKIVRIENPYLLDKTVLEQMNPNNDYVCVYNPVDLTRGIYSKGYCFTGEKEKMIINPQDFSGLDDIGLELRALLLPGQQ